MMSQTLAEILIFPQTLKLGPIIMDIKNLAETRDAYIRRNGLTTRKMKTDAFVCGLNKQILTLVKRKKEISELGKWL